MNIIEQIKAEIERRMKILREDDVVRQNCTSDFLEGKIYGYEEILSLLATLESEKPMQEELEEEIQHQVYDLLFDLDGVAIKGATAYATVDDVAYIARHFAQWGAEHLRDTTKMISDSSEIPNDLEEAARKSSRSS